MTIGLEKILQIKSKVELEQLYNIFVSLIVALILVLAFIALNRPISAQQYHNILLISEQQSCAESQNAAIALSHQRKVNMGQYLKLMQAYHSETVRAHQLPAVAEDSP